MDGAQAIGLPSRKRRWNDPRFVGWLKSTVGSEMVKTHDQSPHGESVELAAASAIDTVGEWLAEANRIRTKQETATTRQLQGVVADEAGVAFAMRFVDRVIRPEDNAVAAGQLAALVADTGQLPDFLSSFDKLLLRSGSRLGPLLPNLVMPLANARMRSLIGHLVVDAEPGPMGDHFGRRRAEGFSLNVNLLGEAVLGEREAARRFDEAMWLLSQPSIDYVSVKLSSVVSQLNYWDHAGSRARVVERLRALLAKAAETSPPTFVNLDMEEYHDLELTIDVFTEVLGERDMHHVDAGIVLQAYLPDSFPVLQELVAWANERHRTTVDGRPGGRIKVRLVKGANLAMERVDATMHGWELATYGSKADTDANYKRCLDWLFTPERMAAVRVGVASHNLFDSVFAQRLAVERGVADNVSLEMLEGMASALARVALGKTGELLLYTPAVKAADFDVAISYLFRRLEENAAEENFIRHLFDLEPGSERFTIEARKFTTAVGRRWSVPVGPNRAQDRLILPKPVDPDSPDYAFSNEPDTDPTLAANRIWATGILEQASTPQIPATPVTTAADAIDDLVHRAVEAAKSWTNLDPHDRRRILHRVADELVQRRGDLIAAAIFEGNKTLAQADPEVSEAIDFARYYADRSLAAGSCADGAVFEPLGVVLVVPPWNFPVAIPTGGTLASLAAGNATIIKPAPQTPRCAEIIAECCWNAGVPDDVLQLVRTEDSDGPASPGRHLVSHANVDAVILTGAFETAELFRSWRPDLRIFAETSGKNSLIITPNADLDLAIDDLVASAFGHSGQKCSAASLAICVGDVYESDRLRRQLVDAVESMQVGAPTDPATNMGPLVAAPTGKLERALTSVEAGEQWLVEPRRINDETWTPGVRIGVQPGSWFFETECFGPVLGVVHADSLDEAIAMQNASAFGLTGGIHSLDDGEVRDWLERAEVGNAYVNRVITGAIVQRQPFGGWKRSSIGPGAKAGGPNYVAQLGQWRDRVPDGDSEGWLSRAVASDREAWAAEFSIPHDPTGLFCEENTLRYRPVRDAVVRVGDGVPDNVVQRVTSAADLCGARVTVSKASEQSLDDFLATVERLRPPRIRVLGTGEPELRAKANALNVHLADDPVTASGRRELLHYVREQAISRTLHRYGNILS